MSRTLAQCGTRAARRRHQVRDETCPTCTTQQKPLAPCGTPAARKRHKRHNQTCTTCDQTKQQHIRTTTTNNLIEDITFLLRAGEGTGRILQATGYVGREKTLQKRLYRANRHDLANHINTWELAA